ncbi:MAG: hypothetical protein K2M05_06515, partial [Paramuribaculum sp.]|nr:hypothetical protein [Paramuribaculum sp.]
SLSSAVYFSIASGYGLGGYGRNGYGSSDWYGSNNGVLNMKFRNADGTFNYAGIQEMNAASTTGSNMILARKNNNPSVVWPRVELQKGICSEQR